MLLYYAASACALASIFAAACKAQALKGDGSKAVGWRGFGGQKDSPNL
jgi:hypothetical protein